MAAILSPGRPPTATKTATCRWFRGTTYGGEPTEV